MVYILQTPRNLDINDFDVSPFTGRDRRHFARSPTRYKIGTAWVQTILKTRRQCLTFSSHNLISDFADDLSSFKDQSNSFSRWRHTATWVLETGN